MVGKFAIQELAGNPGKWFLLRGRYETAAEAQTVRENNVGLRSTRVVELTDQGPRPVKTAEGK